MKSETTYVMDIHLPPRVMVTWLFYQSYTEMFLYIVKVIMITFCKAMIWSVFFTFLDTKNSHIRWTLPTRCS